MERAMARKEGDPQTGFEEKSGIGVGAAADSRRRIFGPKRLSHEGEEKLTKNLESEILNVSPRRDALATRK